MAPPVTRGEQYCEAATKTHIDNTPAFSCSYAGATVLEFQLHDTSAQAAEAGPRSCNYANRKEAGGCLAGSMRHGGTRDWRRAFARHGRKSLDARDGRLLQAAAASDPRYRTGGGPWDETDRSTSPGQGEPDPSRES